MHLLWLLSNELRPVSLAPNEVEQQPGQEAAHEDSADLKKRIELLERRFVAVL
jgi:hypothetical protein